MILFKNLQQKNWAYLQFQQGYSFKDFQEDTFGFEVQYPALIDATESKQY